MCVCVRKLVGATECRSLRTEEQCAHAGGFRVEVTNCGMLPYYLLKKSES